MGGVRVRVPAKVNLQLSVGAARPDGFHDLANVFLAVGLYDEVTVTPADELRITCEGPDTDQVPLNHTNLAARAALALAERYGREPAVHIHIAKDIPVAGGMAGGSADGAAALLACNTLWNAGASRVELLGLCAELGSDVPFSLVGGAALGTGRGERLTALEIGGTFHWVLATAVRGLSTPAVFREFDRLTAGRDIPEPVVSRTLLDALAKADPDALAAAVSNDLQPAALSLFPELAHTLEAGRAAGALTALISGSGPTAAFLTRDLKGALTVAEALRASKTCRTVRTTTAPAPGAQAMA
ncbi:4-(cytidine 5'-diphospho)-2-C-methyl-D-erythritol kinase [Streptomyces sp. NPDC032940]|uniref:4-(cytidine 5'-diphospho)-2-C-methyl-D-erythritol kinase n=1 Tax=Streptomyces sp. NPDC032940 TaxID=3155366 RepID=UPI0033F5F489